MQPPGMLGTSLRGCRVADPPVPWGKASRGPQGQLRCPPLGLGHPHAPAQPREEAGDLQPSSSAVTDGNGKDCFFMR